jgi:tRNA dimethylallyltransferase
VLRREITFDDAIAAAQQGHRNYAKRQGTWFRREASMQWLPGFGDDPEVRKAALRFAQTLAAGGQKP